MLNTDSMIARIALSLWSSGKRVERLPRVTEVQPWETASFVAMPASLSVPAISGLRFEVL